MEITECGIALQWAVAADEVDEMIGWVLYAWLEVGDGRRRVRSAAFFGLGGL